MLHDQFRLVVVVIIFLLQVRATYK